MSKTISVENGSKALKLSTNDWRKILNGLGIALGGAILTWLAELLPMVEFGDYTPIAVAIGGVVVNLGRKWLLDNSK